MIVTKPSAFHQNLVVIRYFRGFGRNSIVNEFHEFSSWFWWSCHHVRVLFPSMPMNTSSHLGVQSLTSSRKEIPSKETWSRRARSIPNHSLSASVTVELAARLTELSLKNRASWQASSTGHLRELTRMSEVVKSLTVGIIGIIVHSATQDPVRAPYIAAFIDRGTNIRRVPTTKLWTAVACCIAFDPAEARTWSSVISIFNHLTANESAARQRNYCRL